MPVNQPVPRMMNFEEEVEELKDWAESHLFYYIVASHSKLLAKRGLLEKEVGTPKSQKGMSTAHRYDYNLK